MAVNAYVLIEAEPGRVKEMVMEMSKIKGVKNASGVTGPYDIIVRLETKDIDALGSLITKKFQTLDGVRKTMTCLCTFCSD